MPLQAGDSGAAALLDLTTGLTVAVFSKYFYDDTGLKARHKSSER